VEVAREWRGSLHQRSWDDPVFLSAYALEPIAFCRGCHAPEADPARGPTVAARRLGVACVTCHVLDGAIASVRARPATATSHAVRGDPRLGTSAACEGCHQFAFPEPQPADMQGTVAEHRASAHAATPCQECHMPRAANDPRRRSHSFAVQGNEALLRSSVRASASIVAPDVVVITLATDAAGHAVPTGDMFRRLEVRARLLGTRDLAAPPVVLARRFQVASGPSGTRRVQVADERLPASGRPREVRVHFPAPIGADVVRWEVVYRRLDAAMAASFGVDGDAEEVVLAAGELAPASSVARRATRRQ
jgi:hypothetical protein